MIFSDNIKRLYVFNIRKEQHTTSGMESLYLHEAIPAQALSYKIGSLKIRELRKKFETQFGDKFSLAAFHDELLKDGVMPLDVLESKMDVWAKKVK